MATTAAKRKQIMPDWPYTMRLSDGRTLATEVPGRWVVRDRGGEICFTPQGVRFLDQIQALFMPLDRPPSPGFIRTLREAMDMTQEEFGRALGVNKLTVWRWERGDLRPAPARVSGLQKLRAKAVKRGVSLAG